jgi:hypothetical protein
MKQLIDILLHQNCSLVVKSTKGEITSYNKKGVRDLIYLLDNDAERLRGAMVADKVIGKAAAGLMVRGGVVEVYADVMSQLALPLLQEAGISYSFGQLVEHIVIPEGDSRCPLEQIVADAQNASEIEAMLREHFAQMQAARNHSK